MKLRLVEWSDRVLDGGRMIDSIVEITPKKLKSGKFDSLTQWFFDTYLEKSARGIKMTIDSVIDEPRYEGD